MPSKQLTHLSPFCAMCMHFITVLLTGLQFSTSEIDKLISHLLSGKSCMSSHCVHCGWTLDL
jgi:hypothetical protein